MSAARVCVLDFTKPMSVVYVCVCHTKPYVCRVSVSHVYVITEKKISTNNELKNKNRSKIYDYPVWDDRM